jgi:hypothetical protein
MVKRDIYKGKVIVKVSEIVYIYSRKFSSAVNIF